MRKLITRKRMFVIICVLMLLSGTAYHTKMWTGRNALDFLLKKCKGYYETTLRICQPVEREGGFHTAYLNGRYFYYDNESRKIYDYAAHKCIIEADREIREFCVNSDSIFYSTGSEIYQYRLDGKRIAKIVLPDEEDIDFVYAGEENIYCEGYDMDLYIFPAKNISEKVQSDIQSVILKSNKKRTVDIDGDKEDIYLINMPEVILGLRTESPGDFKTVDEQGYIRIYNASETDSEIYVMAAETGEKLGYHDKNCIGIFNEELYFLDDRIYRLTDRNQRFEVEDSPLYIRNGFPYSKSVRDGKHLIILGEKYYWGLNPDGIVPSGTVGDYLGSKICYVNLENKKVEKQYEIDKGQVICMFEKQYAVFEDGEVIFYRTEDGKMIKTDKVEGYKTGREYEIEVFHGKIFFFCNEKLLDVIEITPPDKDRIVQQ